MKVRINTYKSFRHYGGREIKTTSHIVNATFCFEQPIDSTTVVTLDEAVGDSYPKGHKIAIPRHNIIER